MAKKISRRDMLKQSAVLVAGAVLAGCAAPAAAPTAAPTAASQVQSPTEAPKAADTQAPAPEATKAEAPAAQPAKKVEGTVVTMHFPGELTKDVIAQIEKEHPGVKVEFVDGTDLTKFYAMYAAGTPPDLVRVQAPSIPQFLARKLLYDLTPYFQTSTVLKIDDLLPANNTYKAESPLKIGSGKIYGMVKDFSPDETLYIYKPAFEAANVPIPDDTKSLSFAELKDIAAKVTKKEGDRIMMFGYGYETGWTDRFWMLALKELGKSLYSENYEKMVLTSDDDAKAIASWYLDMMKENLTYSALNPSPAGWFGTDFQAGQLAILQYGFWYSAMAEGDDTNNKSKGKIMALPAPNWAGKHMDPTITATGMIMTAATKNPDAAWAVFESFNGGAPAVDRAKSGWGVPGLKSMLNLIPQKTDFQKQVYKVLQGELALNDPPLQFNPFLGETQVATSFSKNAERYLKGEIKADEVFKNVEDEVNTAIKDGMSAITG